MVVEILDLPSEIISKIFEEGKSMTDKILALAVDGRRNNGGVPWEVLTTQICSYFRQVSLATPSMWTSIEMGAGCSIDHIFNRLERSGACDLNIRIESAAQDVPMRISVLDAIMDLILPHSRRWRSLCLRYTCEREAHSIVRRICAAAAPRLQILSLTVDDVSEADLTFCNRSVHWPHIFTEGTPGLKFVRLRGLSTQLFRPPLGAVVTLHLDQIRYLPLQYATLRDILTCSPSLANLSIYGDILAPGSWPNQQVNTLNLLNLRSLRMFSQSGETYSGMMTLLNAPMLESLTLKSLQEHDLDELWNAPNQSSRFQNLRSLHFVEFDFTEFNYLRIFQTFRDITTFSALCVPIGQSPLLRLLSQGQIKGLNRAPYMPWPKLQTLGFAADVWSEDGGVVDGVIAARHDCGHPISTLMFAVSPDDGAEEELTLDFGEREDFKLKFCSESLVWPEEQAYVDHEDVLFD